MEKFLYPYKDKIAPLIHVTIMPHVLWEGPHGYTKAGRDAFSPPKGWGGGVEALGELPPPPRKGGGAPQLGTQHGVWEGCSRGASTRLRA